MHKQLPRAVPQENTYARVSFLIGLRVSVCNFIKERNFALVFSWESCEIFSSTYFTEHLRMIAFVVTLSLLRTLLRVKSKSMQALQITKAGDNCSEKLF